MKRRISIVIPVFSFLAILTILLLGILLSGGENSLFVTLFSLLALMLILAGAILFYIFIFDPIKNLRSKLSNMDKGVIPEIIPGKRKDEIGDMERSLKAHFDYLEEAVRFTVEMSRGVFSSDFRRRGNDDQIGKAMLQLKIQLTRTMIESERRRTADEQQKWAAHGLATIGELLRNSEDDINNMSNEFIRELVKYVDMEVGGFFIVKDDEGEEAKLELSGSYAFDREKQISKSFDFGEGLVGRCAVEKDTIVITDLPSDYIRIRSGMGEDLPSTLILVPVLLDQQVLGVIELASFKEVPEYKIRFIESLSNSIAASVTKVKVNISTAKLLQQSRLQSEELSSREEEMRRKMDELKSSLEQSAKHEAFLMDELKKLKDQAGN